MTRRHFFALTSGSLIASAASPPRLPLTIQLHQLIDGKAQWSPGQLQHFWPRLWSEAVNDFQACGIHFQTSRSTGEIWRPSGRQPVISGLVRGILNLVITDRIPMEWDGGRALNGIATIYRGHQVCIVALSRATLHRFPLLSLNTCVHELLHALMLDIFENRPKGPLGAAREFRIDLYATRLWLLRDGSAIHQSAQQYLARLQSPRTP